MILYVEYKATIDNPAYRYGDLNRPSVLEIIGKGIVVHYSDKLDYALVADESIGKVIKVWVPNIKPLVQDSLALRVNHK